MMGEKGVTAGQKQNEGSKIANRSEQKQQDQRKSS